MAPPRPPVVERPVAVPPVPVWVLPVPVLVRSAGGTVSWSALSVSAVMIIVDSDSSSASDRPTAAVSSRLNSAALA